jgi:light-regulated signal transduction histidine kinase (bacteriophytochrome)
VEASLLRSNDDLQEFAYVASHDLQEPVRAVSSYAELLARKLGSHTDETTRLYLQYIVSGALRINTQIRDLLAYSRAAQQSVRMTERVDLGSVCREALLDLAPQVEAAHAEVRYHELPVLTGNAAQLRQVFLNIIGNALKYRRPEATLHVEIRGEHRPGEWLISVRDNGQGFKPEYSERIFHIFKRLHGRELPGNGIGLAICKTIIERHGGRIWATGKPGAGATFYFTLPVRSSR